MNFWELVTSPEVHSPVIENQVLLSYLRIGELGSGNAYLNPGT